MENGHVLLINLNQMMEKMQKVKVKNKKKKKKTKNKKHLLKKTLNKEKQIQCNNKRIQLINFSNGENRKN